MDTNKMREEFIRAYRRLLIAEGMKLQESRFELRDGEFVHRETAIAWWAWQASRAYAVVAIPSADQLLDIYDGNTNPTFNADGMREDLVSQLEALGLKCEVKQ